MLPPDHILHSGSRVLQQKLAVVIQELSQTGAAQETNGYGGGPRSPDMGANTAYGQATAYGNNGHTTPGYNAGAGSAWGQGGQQQQGGTTPYGATPYGRSGNW